MFSLSPIKILVIVAVILVVLGPDKLPQVARQIGQAWRSLRTLQAKIESEVREVVPDLPTSADIARFARSPVNLLNSLADKVTEATTLDTSLSGDIITPDEPTPIEESPPEFTPPYVPVHHVQPTPVFPTSNDPSLN